MNSQFSNQLKTLGFAFAAFALMHQNAKANLDLGLGVKGGINIANANVENANGKEVKTKALNGPVIGGLIEFGAHKPWSLVLEPSYVANGAEFDDFDGKTELTYLQIPILAKAKFGQSNMHVYLFAGPNIAFNLSAEGKATVLGFTGSWNAEDDIKKMDIAGDVGLGASIRIMPQLHLSGDVRYSHGFMNIIDDSATLDSWMSRDVKVLFGLTYHLQD